MIRSIPDIQSNEGKVLEDFKGEIEFRNVEFQYPSRPDAKIFKDFNLKIEEGEMVAIVGKSGCGKTTILKLLLRNYDPLKGMVSIDGHDLCELNLKSLHRKIGVVAQEPVLLKGDIEYNIAYGVDEYTQEELVNACKDANAYDFIMDKNLFPKGFKTDISEDGVNLSGGQKQRIAIARALIKKPKILILDEATSSLDTKSEREVKDAIDQIIENRSLTCIVVAHRLSTIMDADRILMMKKGEIIEQGTHEELKSKKGGAYRKLVLLQLFEDIKIKNVDLGLEAVANKSVKDKKKKKIKEKKIKSENKEDLKK